MKYCCGNLYLYMVKTFIYRMSPIIFACCVQSIAVLFLLAFGKDLPVGFSDWPFFILINIIPLVVGVCVAFNMKTWKERMVAVAFSLVCSIGVLIIYGVIGVAMSLFVFNK